MSLRLCSINWLERLRFVVILLKLNFVSDLYDFRIQEERLKVLVSLLKQREQQHEELNTKHLDKLW